MYKIVFGLSLLWMLANVYSVEVRRDEKVFVIFLLFSLFVLFFYRCEIVILFKFLVAAKAITRLVSTSSQRM